MNEGLAQELSTRAVAAEGKKLEQPTRPDMQSDVAVQLESWTQPDAGDPNADRKEQWGYNAAFYVLRGIENDIGPARMRAVLRNALLDQEAYGVLPGHLDSHVGALPWTTLLDDFDIVGRAQVADALFEKYVVDQSQVADISLHGALRRHYVSIATQAGTWGVPKAVRDTMEQWQNSQAADAQRTTKQILALRDKLQHELGAVHLSLPTTLRDHYQAASLDQLGNVLKELQRYQPAVTAIVHAERTVHGGQSIITRLGLIGADAKGRLAAAETALRHSDPNATVRHADEAVSTVHSAPRRFAIAVGVLIVFLLLLFGLRLWRKRARRRRWNKPWTAPPVAPVDTQAEADDDPQPVFVGAAAAPIAPVAPAVPSPVSEWPSAPPDPPTPA
jgi:hypothetical protein